MKIQMLRNTGNKTLISAVPKRRLALLATLLTNMHHNGTLNTEEYKRAHEHTKSKRHSTHSHETKYEKTI